MNATPAAPIDWSPEAYARFGEHPQVTRHGYHTLPLFEDDALEALLESYPARRLQCYTMGTDPTRNADWRHVDIDPDTSGADLLRAVRNGRLWLNLTCIEQLVPAYRELIDGMYAHLATHCPHLENPRGTHSALLISSPGAQVYYHLDAEPNMLWHLRGRKHVWLYPAMDPELVPQDYLEDIFAGEKGENLPYRPDFDQRAQCHLLEPGDAASWPHNAPHRIVNLDMNVSLATSYTTPAEYRRRYVQLANRHLLRPLGLTHRSMDESGPVAAAKRFGYRAINRLRPFKRHDRTSEYVTDLQLDPDAPLGLRTLSQPRFASFSNARAAE